MAELWIGTHPQGPSRIIEEDNEISLEEVIRTNPVELLGQDAFRRFPSGLPFLFKVLAADRPLSIQVHPDKGRAKKGFLRETESGIPLDSPFRIYRDECHKPELLCALSEFHVLKGFRPSSEAAALLRSLDVFVKGRESLSTGEFFRLLLDMAPESVAELLCRVSRAAQEKAKDDPAFEWVFSLSLQYPDDPGCLAPILLNLITLRPGEALYISPGEVHAYLKGAALEVMANSDNVIRGGLTAKHIDRAGLMQALSFEEEIPSVLKPMTACPCEMQYMSPAEEYRLSLIEVDKEGSYLSGRNRNLEIHLCTQGLGKVIEAGKGDSLAFERGDSFVVPACVDKYSITGSGKIFKVTIPSNQP